MTEFRPFDEKGNMIRTGRTCTCSQGVVSAGRAEAAEIGHDILAQGGNAVDAAVAVAFALGVCEPNASGIGGGGFMLLRNGKTGDSVFLDFRENAPAAATPDMYTPAEPGSNYDKDMGNVYSSKASGVPGDVAGLLYALEHYGTMKPEQVISPAAALAREGFVVTPLLHQDIREHQEQLKKYGDGWKIYLNDGKPWPVGSMLKNPDLADTLDKVAKGGKAVFYEGEIADRIMDLIAKDGGILTRDDLKSFKVRVLEPVRASYRGYELLSSPPPSSGGVHIAQILNVLENFDVASMKPDSAEYLHLLSEVFKICYADRSAYMGDPNFVPVPLEGLLSKEYAKELAERIDMTKAHKPAEGNPFKHESISTTHFSIADSDGNLVAVTRTINHFFGSCAVPEGTGFLLNDEMEDFTLDPSSANAVAGGKIPLSCMSPTILMKDGKPFAVLGSPGGTRIISSVVQVIVNLIDFGMNLEDAVGAPRIGDDQTDLIIYESRIPEETISKLEEMGHPTYGYDDWNRIMGSVNSCMILPDGTFQGVADPRRDGLAVGL
ncbi:MAG: gamma-glutamyltransferase [Firmicutes bacterium]|nr:gamma-glutamyltransferase [Bacillota bacterium]